MNPLSILKDGWRITWRTGALWMLTALLILVMIPELILSGGIGAAAAAVLMPGASEIEWFRFVRDIPGWVWIFVLLAALVVLVATTLVAWGLQAASMRATAQAVEGGRVTLGGALQLGPQRWMSLLKLAVTFGALIGVLALLPPVALMLLARGTDWGMPLMQGYQAVLNPVSSALGIVLMLVMMSIALEDLRPRMAFRRAWQVFRCGWWGFLLVFAANLGMSVVFVAVLTPLLIIALFLALGGATFGVPAAPWLAGLACLCSAPFALALFLFVLIFSTVLYTLTYRAAASLAGPAQNDTRAPDAA